MNKKGASVQTIIIGIIILLITAAIIFYFFKALHHKETIDKEACHQSAILRNNALLKGELGPEIPLNCKTLQIKISTADEEFIKREIANQMYDCWWMLGEGKLNFFKRDPSLQYYKSHCVICTIITFDKNVQERLPEIRGMDEFLATNKIPTKNITYWQYFTNTEAPVVARAEQERGAIKTDKTYAIIYVLSERTTLLNSLSGATCALIGAKYGAVAGAAICSIVPIAGTAAGGLVGGGIGAVIGALGCYFAEEKWSNFMDKNPGYYVGLMFIPSEAEAIKIYGCENIESIP
ncbi:MAG: hypothetical protein K6T16_00495 [Candidatus Pacearchaeota archaeon]|nr:hypothetical protein [Candidatus Pacearchaeota archaeon]